MQLCNGSMYIAQLISRKSEGVGATIEEKFKCWRAKRKASLVLDILEGCTTLAEASRPFHMTPSKIN